jgi:hypothetical protein
MATTTCLLQTVLTVLAQNDTGQFRLRHPSNTHAYFAAYTGSGPYGA